MQSTRLTNFMRENICAKAIKAGFTERVAALAAEEAAMGRSFYEVLVPAAERKLVDKLPKRWYSDDKCLRFNVGGMDLRFDIEGTVRVPTHSGYCATLGSITDQGMVDAARNLFDRKGELKKEKEAAERVLMGLLNSLTTSKQLAETWPEGAEFYAHISAATPNVPAPRVGDINRILGLPREAIAA